MLLKNKILKGVLVVAIGLLISSSALAQQLDFNAEGSHLQFSGVQNQKTAFTGSFANFEPKITIDDANHIQTIEVEIDLTSLNSDDEERDEKLSGSNWFNLDKTPKANFKSTSLTLTSENQYQVEGLLTIREIEKPIRLTMQVDKVNEQWILEGQSQVNRLDWNLGLGAWKDPSWVKHEVEINFKVLADLP